MITSIYALFAAFGGALVLASLLLGGGDADADVDADADLALDVDADADADGGFVFDGDGDADHAHALTAVGHDSAAWLWLPIFSLRFWSFGSAAFGGVGLMLALVGLSPLVHLPVAAVMGVVTGSAATWLFRQLRGDLVSGDVTLDRFAGEVAVVVLRVRPGAIGKIRLQTSAGSVELPARSRDGVELGTGERVLVAAIHDGTADVTGLSPHAIDP